MSLLDLVVVRQDPADRDTIEAVAVDDRQVVTRVVEGTELSDNKGINLPGVAVNVPAMSEKDKETGEKNPERTKK